MYIALGPPAPVKKIRSASLGARRGPDTDTQREWVGRATRAEWEGWVSNGLLEFKRIASSWKCCYCILNWFICEALTERETAVLEGACVYVIFIHPCSLHAACQQEYYDAW